MASTNLYLQNNLGKSVKNNLQSIYMDAFPHLSALQGNITVCIYKVKIIQ